jgi:hypothetical protein
MTNAKRTTRPARTTLSARDIATREHNKTLNQLVPARPFYHSLCMLPGRPVTLVHLRVLP